jgi:hypothetical protein
VGGWAPVRAGARARSQGWHVNSVRPARRVHADPTPTRRRRPAQLLLPGRYSLLCSKLLVLGDDGRTAGARGPGAGGIYRLWTRAAASQFDPLPAGAGAGAGSPARAAGYKRRGGSIVRVRPGHSCTDQWATVDFQTDQWATVDCRTGMSPNAICFLHIGVY